MDSASNLIKDQFKACQRLLVALGDESRQLILTVLMNVECEGIRVGDITEQTHLSRPAVSHHLKILYDAGVVGMKKQGTKHFYYLVLAGQWQTLVSLVNSIEEMRKECVQ
jgi:ArsR family transcriptional regulator